MTQILLFIGTTELLLISGIALLLFGGKKLPEMMRGLGQGVQSFKKGMNDPVKTDEDAETSTDSTDTEKEDRQGEENRKKGEEQTGEDG